MDDPAVAPDVLERSLHAIRRINRLLGYTSGIVREVRRAAPMPDARVLDVATGSGDLPEALLRDAPPGWRVVGVDLHAHTIAVAHKLVRDPRCTFVRADAMSLPFDDRSFDVVTCGLFLHHLGDEQTVRALREMWRVCRGTLVVSDLIRDRRALAWITVLTTFASPIVRHDARASVRHAYTVAELLALHRAAGIDAPSARRTFAHRVLVVSRRGG